VHQAPEEIADELVGVACSLVLARAQLGRIGPRPARTQRSVDDGDSALDLLGQLGDKLVERLRDNFLKIADRSGDRGLIDEQQFGDQFLGDVGAEVHDDDFDRLV
jgi:hypothetical protein